MLYLIQLYTINSYIYSGEANGRGFSIGVKGFLKLFKSLLVQPLDGRMTRMDEEALREETEGCPEVNKSNNVQIELSCNIRT